MPVTGTAAPGFALLNQHGQRIELAALRGRPVLAGTPTTLLEALGR